MAAIACELATCPRKVCVVHLVWVVRNIALIERFEHVLKCLEQPCEGLQIHCYLHVTCPCDKDKPCGEYHIPYTLHGVRKDSMHTVYEPLPEDLNSSMASTGIYDDSEVDSTFINPWKEEYPRIDRPQCSEGSKNTNCSPCDMENGRVFNYDIRFGKPPLESLFMNIADDVRLKAASAHERVVCLVCGPTALIDCVSDLAFIHQFDFQAEEFRL